MKISETYSSEWLYTWNQVSIWHSSVYIDSGNQIEIWQIWFKELDSMPSENLTGSIQGTKLRELNGFYFRYQIEKTWYDCQVWFKEPDFSCRKFDRLLWFNEPESAGRLDRLTIQESGKQNQAAENLTGIWF